MEADETAVLRALEESLWRPETRYDLEYFGDLLASDFVEFGKSGRVYTRADMLQSGSFEPFQAALSEWQLRDVADGVVLTTYVSELARGATIERANRSSPLAVALF